MTTEFREGARDAGQQEKEVDRILALIETQPNRRDRPVHGDPPGDFDYWFDGGACRIITGGAIYELEDGTRVTIALPEMYLESIRVSLPDGRELRTERRFQPVDLSSDTTALPCPGQAQAESSGSGMVPKQASASQQTRKTGVKKPMNTEKTSRRWWQFWRRSALPCLLALPVCAAILPVQAQESDAETWVPAGVDRFYLAGALTRSQGIAYDGDTDSLLFSYQYGLQRTTLEYQLETASPAAIPAEILAQGGNHIGGIDYYAGTLFAPIEDGENYLYPYIVLYNARTLRYTGVSFLLPQELQTEGVPWVAVDAPRGYVYTAEWDPTYAINVFDLRENLNFLGQIQLDQTIGRIQGAKVFQGALYAASDNDDKSVYRIDLDTGHVEELFRMLEMDGVYARDPFLETEDLAFYEDASGALMHVILIQSIFPGTAETPRENVFMPSSSLYHFSLMTTP